MRLPRQRCVAAISQRTALAMICLLLVCCGVWALLGAGLILTQDDTSLDTAAIGAILICYGAACFAIVAGLWKTRNWARQAIMLLSIAMLVADAAVVSIQNLRSDPRNLLLVFPLAFAGLVVWHFSRPEIRALFASSGSSSVTN